MLKYLNGLFHHKKWFILVLCTALGNIFCVHGEQSLRFSVEPADVVTVTGRSVTLHCVVDIAHDYTEEVEIRWRGDDPSSYFHDRDPKRNLLSNGSLFIPHVTAEDQGNYQCVAIFDSIGSMASRFAKVEVAGLVPTLANQPQDLRVFPGQTAHFSCMMNGPLKYSITWLKDERPLVIDSSKMVFMPSGSLEIDKVDSSDQGNYKCNASSSGIHKVSNKAVLTMDMDQEAAANVMAPVFITQPKSVVVQEGSTITLDCAANGFPRPWLIWLKHGVTLDVADFGSRFRKLGTGSLQISKIEEKDAGTYQCRAENGEDSIDATASIEVQVPPRFIRMPQDTTAYEKEDVELSCQVTGKPDPKIQWLKNGEAITINDYLQLVNGYNLKILGLMQMDAGIFQCFASNAAGNIQAAARLSVLQLKANKLDSKKSGDSERWTPFLLKSDNDKYGNSSEDDDDDDYESVPFLLNISHPNISKYSKNNKNPNKLSPQFFSSNNLGGSNFGKEESYSSYLPSKPRDLQAQMISKTFVTLSWKPPIQTNGEIKSYSIYFRQEGSQRERVLNVSGSVTESQAVSGLQPDRLYHFRVIANNANGPGASSDDLKVATEAEIYVPGPPDGINAFATSPTSIYVQWKPPAVTNGDNLQYNLFYMEGDSVDERSIKTPDLSYELNGLNKFTEYSIWVVAYNDKGSGRSSEEVIVRTLSDVPSESPQNVVIEADSATSIIVRWEPPPKDGQNGIITGYKLRYKKQNRRNRGDKGNTVTAAGDRRLHVLSDLDKGSIYQIRLWAMNINGTGPPTDWYPVETYDNDLDETQVPDQPTTLIARPSATSIRVSWGPPKNSNIMVRGYTIRWGKGAPYDYTQILEGKQRTYNIEGLEINSEYVISLSAYNRIGTGQAVYVSVRTREELPPESQTPLMPPVGLKAIVLSATTVVLYWTDTLRNPMITDDRYYSVRYSWAHHPNSKPKYYNTTDLNCMITDLRPNTQYEFSVKLIKGRRESKWSMIVFNTTHEDLPSSPPRDLTIVPVEKNPTQVNLNWQPPKQANGLITGYVILYTTDAEKNEKDWIPQNIVGDKMTAVIKGLKPSTTYYFKIQARNSKGYGPLSLKVSFTTGEGSTVSHEGSLFGKDGRPLSKMIYIILACSLIAVFCVTLIIGIICCKRASARHRNTSGYMKGNLKPNTNMKPPDLWIHHDQMELKALEKSHQSNSDIGPSSSGSQMNTLGRTSSNHQNDFDHSNSLDKRTYLPSYVGTNSNAEKTSTIKRTVKPKPISLPMDSQPIAQPVMTTSTSLTQSPGSELGRPLYPRTQYRAHITLDSSGNAIENPYSLQSAYDSIGTVAPSVIISASGTYSTAPSGGISNQNSTPSQTSTQQSSNIVNGETNGTLGKRQQGHPLKSFSVPAPPPQSAPSTPQQKHVVRPIQGSSPYKKPGPHGIIGTGSPSNTKLRTGPGTAEEAARLQPSYSTEELNQEMANLEGLMKDLNAITASEFEC